MSLCRLRQERDMLHAAQCLYGVPECVQVGTNLPDIHHCWSRVQWSILSWHASDSKFTAYNARDLYLPTMQCSCSCSPSVRDNQPSETTDTCVHFIIPMATQ